ncbi:MAG: RNA polymerase sigma factor [Muribaculaceae bacterium]|nr:RNA polymerase sigma factor [Muribaculaceae bacterium]
MTEATFKHIAAPLRETARTTALAFGINESQAEDLAQDVMLKLWMMRDDLDRYRSLNSLVIVMTRHLATDNRRRKQPTALNVEAFQISNSFSPHEQLEEIENDRWLRQHLKNLPSRQHSVLMMRQVEHRSYQEIANLLGITETSARSLIARARKSLFEEYKKRM